MPLTPQTGSIAAVADMATAIIGMVQTYEASHNTPGMLQAAIAAQWEAMKETATKAVSSEDAATVEKDIAG